MHKWPHALTKAVMPIAAALFLLAIPWAILLLRVSEVAAGLPDYDLDDWVRWVDAAATSVCGVECDRNSTTRLLLDQPRSFRRPDPGRTGAGEGEVHQGRDPQ